MVKCPDVIDSSQHYCKEDTAMFFHAELS